MTNVPSQVFLWTIPRGGSTVFYKSMTGNCDIKAYFEPFATANRCGPDSLTSSHKEKGISLEPEYTFDAVRGWLEAEHLSGNDVVVKDFAVSIQDRFHLIPEGYRHSFLIRKPESVFMSYYKLFKRTARNADQSFQTWLPNTEHTFKSLSDVAEHVETKLEKDITIIDFDDVKENPAQMIQKYCQSVGFHYDEGFLHWNKGFPVNCPKTVRDMESDYKWMDVAINSAGWSNNKIGGPEDELIQYPPIVWNRIEEAQPYYKRLRDHAKCLRLENSENSIFRE